MNRVRFDTAETGLRAVMKDYQDIALKVIWASPEGLSLRVVWDRVNARLQGKTINHASVFNFLEAVREAGILKGKERMGMGGHRWIYSLAMNESEYKKYVARNILGSLMRGFPEETKIALGNLRP
jgi:hypothetical protein